MKKEFKDAKTPQDILQIELREETHGDILEVTVYEGTSALVYLDRGEALRLAKAINDIFDS